MQKDIFDEATVIDDTTVKTLLKYRREGIEDARMNLLWGIVLSCVLMLAACAVAFAERTFTISVSEAFQDTSSLQGKLFIVSLLVPSFSFWVSGYHWKLDNVRINEPGFQNLDWWCRFLRILSNVSFIVVAFVPHIAWTVLKGETTPGGQVDIAYAFARIHLVCGILSFAGVGISEMLVICNNIYLSCHELRWRRFSAAAAWSIVAMYLINTVALLSVADTQNYRFAKNWTFRFEVCIGSGFMWMNQLVWCFSDPAIADHIRAGNLLWRVFPYPHMSASFLILVDVYRCGLDISSILVLGLELLVLCGLMIFGYPFFEKLFNYRDPAAGNLHQGGRPEPEGSRTYGSTTTT